MRTYTMILSAALSIAPLSYASAAGWTTAATITSLNQQPASSNAPELFVVELSLTSNPSGCGNMYHLAVTNDRQKRIVAMLLSAKLADRPVQLFFTGTCHSVVSSAQIDGAIVL